MFTQILPFRCSWSAAFGFGKGTESKRGSAAKFEFPPMTEKASDYAGVMTGTVANMTCGQMVD
jgi:hypothetical protein